MMTITMTKMTATNRNDLVFLGNNQPWWMHSWQRGGWVGDFYDDDYDEDDDNGDNNEANFDMDIC